MEGVADDDRSERRSHEENACSFDTRRCHGSFSPIPMITIPPKKATTGIAMKRYIMSKVLKF